MQVYVSHHGMDDTLDHYARRHAEQHCLVPPDFATPEDLNLAMAHVLVMHLT